MYNELTVDTEEVERPQGLYRVRVVHDPDAYDFESPRDADVNLGTMVLRKTPDYIVPAEGDHAEGINRVLMDYGLDDGFPIISRWLRVFHGATVVVPAYCESKSSSGVIYDTPKARAECGTPPDLIEQVLKAEVREYEQWARGDLYGFVVEEQIRPPEVDANGISRSSDDGVWETIESCWGFYEIDYAMQEGKECVPAPDESEKVTLSWSVEVTETWSRTYTLNELRTAIGNKLGMDLSTVTREELEEIVRREDVAPFLGDLEDNQNPRVARHSEVTNRWVDGLRPADVTARAA